MSKSRPPHAGVTRKHLARAERDALYQKWIIRVSVGIAVLVVGLLAYGWIDANVLQLRRPVAKVGEVEITTEQFQKAARYVRLQLIEQAFQLSYYINIYTAFGADAQTINFYENQLNSVSLQLENPVDIGQQALDNLIEEQLIRQEAARRGISVSPAEIDQAVEEGFGFYQNGTPTPLPTFTPAPTDTPAPTNTPDPALTPAATATLTNTPEPTATATSGPSPTPLPTSTPYTREGFEIAKTDFLTDAQKNSGLTEADYRAIVEVSLLRKKLIEAFGAGISAEVATAHVRHILIQIENPDDPESVAKAEKFARGIIVQLQQGDDFAELARIHSTDTSNKDQGGDLGVADEGAYVAEFEAVAFNPDNVGLYPEPVKTEFGYHIIDVLEHGARTLNEGELQSKKTSAFNEWLTAEQAKTDLVQEFEWQLLVPTHPTFEDVSRNRPTSTPGATPSETATP